APDLLRSAGLKASGLPPLRYQVLIRLSPRDCSRTVSLERALLLADLLRELLVRGSEFRVVISAQK
ncbi:hypothetical protein A2U01_0084259, partial [Trifolium medium]|nr:hypothetical protein [Trifolium medium]